MESTSPSRHAVELVATLTERYGLPLDLVAAILAQATGILAARLGASGERGVPAQIAALCVLVGRTAAHEQHRLAVVERAGLGPEKVN